ncbi:MAG: hypothetical protein LIO44_03590, partial [Eubacterium sp.]|nr:hypothetical protein [Eubacterium sp.]
MKKFIRNIVILACVVGILYALCKIALDESIKVREYNVETEKAVGEVKLLLITDLHCSLYGECQSVHIG